MSSLPPIADIAKPDRACPLSAIFNLPVNKLMTWYAFQSLLKKPMIEPCERLGKLAERYQRFAELEARGVSPTYEKLALAIYSSIEILEFIARLPEDRQQPNLFLAAIRKVAGVPRSCDQLVEIVR